MIRKILQDGCLWARAQLDAALGYGRLGVISSHVRLIFHHAAWLLQPGVVWTGWNSVIVANSVGELRDIVSLDVAYGVWSRSWSRIWCVKGCSARSEMEPEISIMECLNHWPESIESKKIRMFPFSSFRRQSANPLGSAASMDCAADRCWHTAWV